MPQWPEEPGPARRPRRSNPLTPQVLRQAAGYLPKRKGRGLPDKRGMEATRIQIQRYERKKMRGVNEPRPNSLAC